MTTQAHKIRAAKAARIDRRLAEIHAEAAQLLSERAKISEELAEGEAVDLRTGRQVPKRHVPELPDVSEFNRARALQALQVSERRRRVRA